MKRILLWVISLIILAGCSMQNLDIDEPDIDETGMNEDTENSTIEDIIDIRPVEKIEEDLKPLPYRPIGVMIENTPQARPQSGLIEADVIYEMYVEGGITRFLALFLSKYPKVVGPVRSARHYYVDIVEEWDALYVHYGGSRLAREELEKRAIKRVDGMQGNTLYWRDNSRVAPHNAYIDISECEKLIDYKQSRRDIKRMTGKASIGIDYSSVNIPFNSTFSNVEYVYDGATGKHMRSTNGNPSTDKEDGKQLFADNIVIQYTGHVRSETGAGYREIDLIGSGNALYFIGGRYVKGTWRRLEPKETTLFLDESGNEIGFMDGNIWIHIVPENMKINIQ